VIDIVQVLIQSSFHGPCPLSVAFLETKTMDDGQGPRKEDGISMLYTIVKTL
jgi:hypothetical protein